MNTLKEVPVGKSARVVKLHGEGAIKRRIMDMGITKGVEVFVRKVAPLGDPMEISLRGYELSLRKADACHSPASSQFLHLIPFSIRIIPCFWILVYDKLL